MASARSPSNSSSFPHRTVGHSIPNHPRTASQSHPVSEDVPTLAVGPFPVPRFLSAFLTRRPGREIGGTTFQAINALSDNPAMSAAALTIAILELCPSVRCCLANAIQGPATISLLSWMLGYQEGTDFSQVEMFADVVSCQRDPFVDGGSLSCHSIKSTAEKVFGAQFRTHLFSFCVFGPFARLFRWDVAGVLVTDKFDYTETDFLAEFLWRFDGMSSSDRGIDASVVPLTNSWPTDLAPRHVLRYLQTQDEFHEKDGIAPATRRHRRFCLLKRTDASQEIDALISFPPKYERGSHLGQATRPMHAYDIQGSRLIFVKQCWRDGRKEGDVYAILMEKGVRNLPGFVDGNDVRAYATRTQRYTQKPWYQGPDIDIPKRRLYRMAFSTIGVPLTDFRNTRELVGAIRDAMQCHDNAFFKAHVLHRDISVGNIMIDRDTRKGILIDWELSSSIAARGRVPIGAEDRVGTWPFMSASLLEVLYTPHTVLDDRESALYVLVWVLVLYFTHNQYHRLDELLEIFYERIPDIDRTNGQKVDLGGDVKRGFLWGLDFSRMVLLEEGRSVAAVVTTLQRAFGKRYRWMPCDGDDPKYFEVFAEKIKPFEAEGWFVDILTKALDDPAWLDSSRAEPNYIVQRKRDRERDEKRVREEEDRLYRRTLGRKTAKVCKLGRDGDVSAGLVRLLVPTKSMPAKS